MELANLSHTTSSRLEEIQRIVADSATLYPDCRHLASSNILLLAECNRPAEALLACEQFLISFGYDDTIVSLGLILRQQIGFHAPEIGNRNIPAISLCMIVKNEEKNLPRCLTSLKPIVQEIIIVDTGSTDRTTDIATIFGAKVFTFPWNGNFSDARNISLDKATGQWILVMDADEVLSVNDYGHIRGTVSNNYGNICWSVTTRNYTRLHPEGWVANDGSYPHEERAEGWHPSTKIRLFPNDVRIRFAGEVHEMLERAAQSAGYRVCQAPFVVHHYGGLTDSPSDNLEKKLAYFELGKQKLSERPRDLSSIGELAVQASELGRYEEAIELWNRFLDVAPDAVVALFNKGFALMRLERFPEALDISSRALELEPFHKEAAFNYGLCALYVGNNYEAIQRLELALEQNNSHPPLLAVLTLLAATTGMNDQVRQYLDKLSAINYSIKNFITDRVNILQKLGKRDRAEAISKLLTP